MTLFEAINPAEARFAMPDSIIDWILGIIIILVIGRLMGFK